MAEKAFGQRVSGEDFAAGPHDERGAAEAGEQSELVFEARGEAIAIHPDLRADGDHVVGRVAAPEEPGRPHQAKRQLRLIQDLDRERLGPHGDGIVRDGGHHPTAVAVDADVIADAGLLRRFAERSKNDPERGPSGGSAGRDDGAVRRHLLSRLADLDARIARREEGAGPTGVPGRDEATRLVAGRRVDAEHVDPGERGRERRNRPAARGIVEIEAAGHPRRRLIAGGEGGARIRLGEFGADGNAGSAELEGPFGQLQIVLFVPHRKAPIVLRQSLSQARRRVSFVRGHHPLRAG